MKSIPYGRQTIDVSDIQAVSRILNSDWLTQGPSIQAFEEQFAAFCNAKYAVAVANGTAALHLACLAAGLAKGDEAVTSPISFMATSNAVLYAGAKPVFSDVDYTSVNLDPGALIKKINRKTKAVLPVDFSGLPANLREISAIAQKYGLVVIEDACHAVGAQYQGSPIGSCRYSDMAVFSFHPVKPMTTGEGGCITTNSKTFYRKLIALRQHGIYKDPAMLRRHGPWYMEMRDLGYNYRLTDFQSALGISQLKKLPAFIQRRHEIAEMYVSGLADLKPYIQLPRLEYPDRSHAWHLFLLRLNLKVSPITRRELFEALWERNIRVQVHYIPIYHQPYYRKNVPQKNRCLHAEQYYRETISLPIYPGLTDPEVQYVIRSIQEIFSQYSKQKPTHSKDKPHELRR